MVQNKKVGDRTVVWMKLDIQGIIVPLKVLIFPEEIKIIKY
jgi:hypothetical protein